MYSGFGGNSSNGDSSSSFAVEDVKLKAAYKSSLQLAQQVGAKTVGFSLISAGVFAGSRGV